MEFAGINALVVGMEKSGQASAAFLRARGADVTTTDIRPHECAPDSGCRRDALFAETWRSDRAFARRSGSIWSLCERRVRAAST